MTVGVQLKRKFLTFEGLLKNTLSSYPIACLGRKMDDLFELIRRGGLDWEVTSLPPLK